MFSYVQDLVHAARSLTKARAFTAVCVVSLGLGMSVVIGIMLLSKLVVSTPPGVDDDGLVEFMVRPSGALLAQTNGYMIDTWSYPDYLDVRDAATGLAPTGWSYGDGLVRFPHQSGVPSVPTMYVSSNYFSTVGVSLARGRGFTPVGDASRAEPEAVISHRTWQVRLGSDPNVVGRTLTINSTEYVIVGVTPERFRGHVGGLDSSQVQLWLPLSRHPRLTAAGNARVSRDAAWVRILGRLPAGSTMAQADGIVRSAMAGLVARYPSSHQDKTGGVEPYFPPGARLRAQIGFARMMMFGLSGIVLLVVGLNISGMMLVRSAMRQRELAIRLAMGASRWRLMRHHLTEALVMALLGGSLAAGLLFGVPVVVAWAMNLSDPALELFKPDVWVAAQCVALCFVTSLVLGLLPAVRFSRPAVLSALKSDSSGSGRRVGRLQRFTAAAQAGLAVPFLVIGGLKIDQARMTAMADAGFQPRGLYAASLNLTAIGKTDDERHLFVQTVHENLAAAPGVVSASVADGVPLDFNDRLTPVVRDGGGNFFTAHTTRIGPGYMETVGIRMLAGRTVQANDRAGGELVVLLSAPLAQQLFPDGDPIGQRVAFALSGAERQTYTVVGVTADVVSTQMINPRPQLFVSLAQHPSTRVMAVARGAAGDPAMTRAFEQATAEALRHVSAPVEHVFVVSDLMTGEYLVDLAYRDLLTHSAMSGVAATVALVLAALGVYGVIAFMVAIRTREIGVRVALGASRARVLRDVLGNALTLVVPGIGVGLVLAVLWVRMVEPTWYPLGGVEPLLYVFAAVTAFVVAALAGIPSARRAAAVQPIIAMRAD